MKSPGFGFLLLIGAALCATAASSEEPKRPLPDTVIITWDGASAPVGRFLLIRKDKAVCAVRFTQAERFRDRKPPTTFNSGEESFSAEYDWWFQKDGSGDFLKSTATSGHEELHSGPLKGIGRLAFQTGSIYLKCSQFELLWRYPSWVRFWGAVKDGDYGIELAPTPWKELSEIKLDDPKLKWHRYDERRELLDLPFDEYWAKNNAGQTR